MEYMRLIQLLAVVVCLAAYVHAKPNKTVVDSSSDSDDDSAPKCEELTEGGCQDLGYKTTTFPNLKGHANQQEASSEFSQWHRLVSIGCSRATKPFLCSYYFPKCSNGESLPPCRHVCQTAYGGCNSLMWWSGYSWPDFLDCSKFPDSDDPSVCNNDM